LSNKDSGIDIYTKGALMLHTLSAFAESREQWQAVLRDFALSMKFQKVSTEMLVNWFSSRLKGVTPAFFYQYLTLAQPPILEYNTRKTSKGILVKYRIVNAIQGFEMPIYWTASHMSSSSMASGNWQEVEFSGQEEPIPDLTRAYFILKP
jgi:aminopeptidase N